MYDLASAHTGRRGRPAKHGKQLSVETDFTFSGEKIGDYYTGVRRVFTRLMSQPQKKSMVKNACFQYDFSRRTADFLCMAGKSTIESDRQ